MSQPTNQELYIINTFRKNRPFERKINHISCGSSFIEIPQYTIYDWLENAKIESSHLTTLLLKMTVI